MKQCSKRQQIKKFGELEIWQFGFV